MQLGSKTASLQEQSVYGEGLGSRRKGSLSWAPERLHTDTTSGVASSAWPSVSWVWGDKKKSTETENKPWITVTSKKPVVIVVISRSHKLPAGKDILSIPPCYAHCKAWEGLSHPDSFILPVLKIPLSLIYLPDMPPSETSDKNLWFLSRCHFKVRWDGVRRWREIIWIHAQFKHHGLSKCVRNSKCKWLNEGDDVRSPNNLRSSVCLQDPFLCLWN